MDDLVNVSNYWFSAHPEQAISPEAPRFNNEIDHYLWPTADRYKSPITTAYASYLPNLEAFSCQKRWILRDGLASLLWFFHKNPDPAELSSKLLIHKDLLDYVPTPWKPFIGSYRLFSDNSISTETRRILLVGLLSETYITKSELTKKIAEMKKVLSDSHLNNIEVLSFLPSRDFTRNEKVDFKPVTIELLGPLIRAFPNPIESISLQKCFSFSDMSHTLVFDIGSRILNADNGLEHMCLKKGATSLTSVLQTSKDSGEVPVYLSGHHGFLVNEVPEFKDTKPKIDSRELALITDEAAFTEIPWPSIYIDWAQHMIQNSGQ